MQHPALIVTRVATQAEALTQACRAAGVRLIALPLQHIGPPRDLARFHSALAALAHTDLAVPVSPTAVAAVFAALRQPWPAHCAIGVVGQGSLHAVRRALQAQPADAPWPRVIAPDLPPQAGGEGDSAALWDALQRAFAPGPVAGFPWAGRRVQIYRGGSGRDDLVKWLEQTGAQVNVVQAYSRLAPQCDAQTVQQLRAALDSGGWWLFSSSEAVRNLQGLMSEAGIALDRLRDQRALAIHPHIAQTLQAAGFGQVEITAAAADAVLATLRRLGPPRDSRRLSDS